MRYDIYAGFLLRRAVFRHTSGIGRRGYRGYYLSYYPA